MILFARSSRHGENNTSKGSLLLCKSGMSLIARSSSNVVSAVDLSLGRRLDRVIALCKQTLLRLLTAGIDTRRASSAPQQPRQLRVVQQTCYSRTRRCLTISIDVLLELRLGPRVA